MGSNVKIDELRKLPHVNCEDMQGRTFPLHPLLDESGWHLWIPQNDGTILDFKGSIPVEVNYFSKVADRSDDLIFPFLEFLEKRAFWPDIQSEVIAITNDIHNLAASMAKISLFFQENRRSNLDVRRMVGTELEYIFTVCRSLFDLLQKIIKALWRRATRCTPGLKEQHLSDSFRQMCLLNNQPMSVEEIISRKNIPRELAIVYNHNAIFFEWLRDYRDCITHGNGEFNLVFIDKKGFAIAKNEAPFNNMLIWSDTNTLPNNLGSLKSVASYIISLTLDAFENALDFFKTTIKFPADVAPNHRMYTRGVHNSYIVSLDSNITNPW